MKQTRRAEFFSREGLTNFWFKKDEANRTIFFPWGAFGKGRVIPDKTSEVRIRGCVGFHWSGIFSTGIVAGVASTYTLYFLVTYAAICAIWLAWYYFEIRTLVRGFPFSETKLTFVESYANYYSEWSSFTLWLGLIFMILFLVGSIAFVVIAWTEANNTVDRLIAIGCVLFSAWLVRTLGYVLRARRSVDKSRAKNQDRL